MREIWVVMVLALALAAGHPAVAQAPKPDNAPAANAASLLAPNPQDRVLGKPDAPITIVEYASLSCSHCANFSNAVLPTLKKNWIDTGKAKLVLRDFPLDEPALRAEMLLRCAPPERFYPLAETLFETQDKWAVAKDQIVQSRLTAAQQLGVNSTPTFFINGKKYEGEPTIEAFEQVLSGLAAKS
jgi:protein-disulfide isomerase